MKLTSVVYQSLLFIYRALPFRPFWARVIRGLPIDLERYYRDLHFNGVFTVKSDSGQFRINHLGTTIENELFWKGLDNSLERDTMWIWKLLSLSSDTILDVGANTGVYSLVAKTENPKARVIAFEPSRKVYPELKRNIMLNSFEVKTEQIALSNSNRTQVFYDLDWMEFPTSGSLSPAKEKNLRPGRTDIAEHEVQCSTLDHYLDEKKIGSVDLMKVDVELHEPEVFEGFSNLQKFRPAIVIEVLTADVARRIEEVADLTGYRYLMLIDTLRVREFDNLKADPDHRNHLLLPEEHTLPANVIIESH